MANSTKKAAPTAAEDTPAVENTCTEESAAQVNDSAPKTTTPKPAKCGFCVYLGPTIRAEIQNATIFNVSRDKALKDNAELIKKYPLVATLIVPGDEIATARIKVSTPGNILHIKYMQLAGQLK
jgi:hypothetical protein